MAETTVTIPGSANNYSGKGGFYSIPGWLGLPPTAPQYAGGIALDQLVATPKPDTGALTGPQASVPSASGQRLTPQIAPDQRFWSSPARPMTYPYNEGIIVNLTKTKTINYLALDLPAFPHHFFLYWWEDSSQSWQEFTSPNGGRIEIYIDGSTPPVVGSAAAYQAHQHPSHYGAGHWLHYDLDINCVTTSKIKLFGNRNFGSRKGGPVTPQGSPAPYSLGVKNFDFGCRCRTKDDIPRMARDPDIITERQSFTQTIDLCGCPVELKVRENRATDLLRGGVWKSEAMPVPYAVVNFYVDARDDFGNPQVIDRFNVTPLHSGPNLNLYYATEVPDANSGASDDPLVFPNILTAGANPPLPQDEGLCFKDEPSYITISNSAVQWDPSKPFWFALEFQPQWDSDDNTPHVIFDTGAFQFGWSNGVFRLGCGDGVIYMAPFDFSSNSRLKAVAGYDGERLSFYMPDSGAIMNAPADLTAMVSDKIRIGAEEGPTTSEVIFTGDFRLNAFLVKQETLSFVSEDNSLTVPVPVQRFLVNPDVYLDKPQFARDEDGSTDNAILRYLPRFVCGDVNPYGFVGGPGDIYEDVVWTPVMRDYKLHAGMMQFHPVRAKFFKFEFSCLTPEPYKTYMPLTRTVRTYSQAATLPVAQPQLTSQYSQSAQSPGLSANVDATMQTVRYADTPSITAASSQDILPTEALTARNAGIQNKLDAFGGMYRFQSWQTGGVGPVYAQTSKHYYETVEIDCANECAYFVGLSKIEMYRVDYATDDDTDQYIDLFDDLNNVDPDYVVPKTIVGTTNYVINPSFENGTTSYSLYTHGTATGAAFAMDTTGLFKYGLAAMRISATGMGSTGTDILGFNSTYTTPDFANSIAYSIYARKHTGQGTLRLLVEYYDASNTYLTADSSTFNPDDEGLGTPLNPNTNFEGGTAGWAATGNTTIAAVSTYSFDGTQSLRITPGGGQATVGAATTTTAKLVVKPNAYYRLSGRLMAPGGYADLRLAVDWYATDSDASFISTGFGTLTTIPATTNWSPRLDTLQAPANATRCTLRVRIGSTPLTTDIVYADALKLQEIVTPFVRCSGIWLPPLNTESVIVYWWVESATTSVIDWRFDGFQIEGLHLTDYYDGSLPGGKWNDTPYNSTSTRTNIDINPWGWDGDKLFTGSSLEPAQSQSSRFPSKRAVRGIQFASQQSNPVQLVPDPDFISLHLEDTWLPVGDVITMESSNDVATTLGNSVKILRSSAINTWVEIRGNYPTWGSIAGSNNDPLLPSYASLEGDASVIGYGGIALRSPVQVSEAGRVTAAGRVYADHALSTPLILQIVSPEGDILASVTQEVRAGRVVEFFVDYVVQPTSETAQTWADIMRFDPSPTQPTYGALFGNTWGDLTSTDVSQSRQVGIRIVQQGAGEDTWYVDSLALFEDPILWEFSNDDGFSYWPALGIRNNPQGVLVFPPTASGGLTGLRWRVTGYRPNLHISALDIRPWYGDLVFGMPIKEAGVAGGPCIQPTDHYPPIDSDPFFQQWSGSVPQDWYYTYRQLLLLNHELVDITVQDRLILFANPFSLLIKEDVIPPIPAYVDPYQDVYTDRYGVPNPDAAP